MKALRGIVLDIPRQQSVVTDPTDETMRLLLLKEEVKDGSLTEELSEERRAEIGVDALERTTHELVFSYEYFNAEQVMRMPSLARKRWLSGEKVPKLFPS